MKKIFILILLIASTVITLTGISYAQTTTEDLYKQVASGGISCSNLTEQDFENLGEFYMERMVGISHENMDRYMEQMMGGDFVNQMHIAMGKRLSGCDVNYQVNADGGFVPMMGMMMNFSQGGWSAPFNNKNFNTMPMMSNFGGNWGGMMPYGFGFGFSWLGAIFMVIWWAIIIAAIVLFVRWIVRQGHNWKHEDKDAVGILKERYAKGEIDKVKYEEMKKELEK